MGEHMLLVPQEKHIQIPVISSCLSLTGIYQGFQISVTILFPTVPSCHSPLSLLTRSIISHTESSLPNVQVSKIMVCYVLLLSITIGGKVNMHGGKVPVLTYLPCTQEKGLPAACVKSRSPPASSIECVEQKCVV